MSGSPEHTTPETPGSTGGGCTDHPLSGGSPVGSGVARPAASEPPPALGAAAEHYFGSRLGLAVRYAAHLGGSGVQRGLIGPREADRLWDRHLLNCAAVAEVVPAGVRVVDVGSGAGLPGLVLGVARPDLDIVLLEPLLRRVTWLDEVLADLAVPGVRVVRGRAEEPAAPRGVEVVCARAVAALPQLAAWCLPLLGPGGTLLALKGETAPEELADAEAGLVRSGAASWDVVEVGGEWLDTPTRVVRVVKGTSEPSGRRHRRTR